MAEASAPLTALLSRIEEIQKLCTDDESDPSDAHHLLEHCALHVQSRVDHALSDFSDFSFFGDQDFDACLGQLKEEHNKVEAESTEVAKEIELLTETHKDDCKLLQAKLEEIKCSLDYIASKDEKIEEDSEGTDSPMLTNDHTTCTAANQTINLEQILLESEIDEMKSVVKSLEDLQCKVKWFDAVEQIEDALAGLKVLAFDGNCIRLSLRTYMPKIEGLPYLERIQDTIGVTELNHELLIEVFEGTMQLKNVQFMKELHSIVMFPKDPGVKEEGFPKNLELLNAFEVFPNNIHVSDIVDAAKSVSKSSLQWFITRVQDRIILSTLRRLVVKDANQSRYTLEYLDKDETVVAHMAGGIDAYIELSHGWPIFASPLTLISVKGSDCLKGTSLRFHGKVEKLTNALDSDIRQNILSFVDAVERVLKEQLQVDLSSQ